MESEYRLMDKLKNRVTLPGLLLLHSLIFGFISLWSMFRTLSLPAYHPYFFDPNAANLLMLWSLGLLVHGFLVYRPLDTAIRQKAVLTQTLFRYTVLNALLWVWHVAVGPGSLVAWHGTFILAIFTVFSFGVGLYDQRSQKAFTKAKYSQRKSETDYERIADDDALISLDEYREKAKRQA